MLDLRRVYLQVRVHESLWRFQAVRHENKSYFLTRLGFGLASAPKIMQAIVKKVLEQDAEIANNTDHYIDDIIVKGNAEYAESVSNHLLHYGLKSKPAVPLSSARVLGLQILPVNNVIEWRRGNSIPEVRAPTTRQQLFSL